MRYWLRTTCLALFILFSNFQCSRWAKYAENINLEINPDELTSINDSVNVLVEASMQRELTGKIDSVKINFYYLQEDSHYENEHDEIGNILLTSTQRFQSKNFKFRFIEGRSLYVKHIVKKNKKKIESPLVLVAE